MKVTIYEIAKRANVSIATVSKVINNNGRISENTRKKVKKIIEETNYEPNMIASALMGKQTKTIGLLIPDLSNPFFAELAKHIEVYGQEYGYNIVICNTDYDSKKENSYISLLLKRQIDGFILASGFERTEKVEELLNNDIPVVIVARDFPMLPVNTVAIDDYMGGYMAAKHLIGLGHKHIGVIARDLQSNRERLRGFKAALKENKLTLHPEFHYMQDEDQIKVGKEMAKLYFDSQAPITAIFACSDLIAAGVIQKSKEYSLSIPGDISIVGFDNISIASIIEPTLTSIAQPINELGKEVVSLIISIIKGDRNNQTRIVLHPSIVKRNSSGKAVKRS